MKSQIPILLELSSLKDERNSWEWQCGVAECLLPLQGQPDTLLPVKASWKQWEVTFVLRALSLGFATGLEHNESQRVLIGWLVGLLIDWLIGEDLKRAYRPVLSQCASIPPPSLGQGYFIVILTWPQTHTRLLIHQLVWSCRFLQWWQCPLSQFDRAVASHFQIVDP